MQRWRMGGGEKKCSTGWAGGGGKVRETVGRRDEMSKGVMIGGGGCDESLQMSHHISTRRADGAPNNIMRYSLVKGLPSHFQTPGWLPYLQLHRGGRGRGKKNNNEGFCLLQPPLITESLGSGCETLDVFVSLNAACLNRALNTEALKRGCD